MAESTAAAAVMAGENGREQRARSGGERRERGWPNFVRRWQGRRRKQVICLREDIRKFSSSFSCSRRCSVEGSKLEGSGVRSVVSTFTLHCIFMQRGFEKRFSMLRFIRNVDVK